MMKTLLELMVFMFPASATATPSREHIWHSLAIGIDISQKLKMNCHITTTATHINVSNENSIDVLLKTMQLNTDKNAV